MVRKVKSLAGVVYALAILGALSFGGQQALAARALAGCFDCSPPGVGDQCDDCCWPSTDNFCTTAHVCICGP
jgi:hypothetical protein